MITSKQLQQEFKEDPEGIVFYLVKLATFQFNDDPRDFSVIAWSPKDIQKKKEPEKDTKKIMDRLRKYLKDLASGLIGGSRKPIPGLGS